MNIYLDRLLNHFSMYKVASGALGLLFVIALIFSFLGMIVYSPLAMLASVIVLGLSVWLTSLLLGLLFGVSVQAESSFITALILFFIFTPTLQLTGLLALLLIGMVAAASKFILVYKGRHIFNPAALAAFVIGLTGLGYATWWVATPILIIPTFLLGFAIIYKTRRVAVSGTFLAIATFLLIVVLTNEGATLNQSLVLWFSWPILFFASFMLTEPLTLPQKKWQTVFEAVVVALIFIIPIQIAGFSSNPALALLIGNLIAFGFGRRRSIMLKFKEIKQLTPTSFEFIFEPSRSLSYEAGQYIDIMVPSIKDDWRGRRRSFSITSAPSEPMVRLGIKFYEPSSTLKNNLRKLKSDTIIQSTGINGDFTLPKDAGTPLVYIAGGIGITPFMSHLAHLKLLQQTRDITLFYAVNNVSELAYHDLLVTSGIKVCVVTKSNAPLMLPNGWVHRNEPFISEKTLIDIVPDIVARTVYLSGPPNMIDGVKKYLKKLHVRSIKTDYFIGY